MDISKLKIEEFIVNKIKEFAEENDIEWEEISVETRLIGSNGLFDSMDLVRFIVELEEGIEDEFNHEISLMDEKAMSRSTSPFINTITLSKYIIESING